MSIFEWVYVGALVVIMLVGLRVIFLGIRVFSDLASRRRGESSGKVKVLGIVDANIPVNIVIFAGGLAMIFVPLFFLNSQVNDETMPDESAEIVTTTLPPPDSRSFAEGIAIPPPTIEAIPALLRAFAPGQPRVAAVEIDPGRVQIDIGETVELFVMAKDENGNNLEGLQVEWVYGEGTREIVDVLEPGKFTGKRIGSVTVYANVGLQSSAAIVEVIHRVESVSIDPGSMQIMEDEKASLRAILTDSGGDEVQARNVLWTIRGSEIRKVPEHTSGTRITVEGMDQGTALVEARVDDAVGEAVVKVVPIPVVSFRLRERVMALRVGEKKFLIPTLLNAHGRAVYRKLVWVSNDESVATVDIDGGVTGVTPGTTTIDTRIDQIEAEVVIAVRGD